MTSKLHYAHSLGLFTHILAREWTAWGGSVSKFNNYTYTSGFARAVRAQAVPHFQDIIRFKRMHLWEDSLYSSCVKVCSCYMQDIWILRWSKERGSSQKNFVEPLLLGHPFHCDFLTVITQDDDKDDQPPKPHLQQNLCYSPSVRCTELLQIWKCFICSSNCWSNGKVIKSIVSWFGFGG